MYSGPGTLAGGFPHSDIFGSKLICQLPEAFRRLSRLSSPVIAKASTTCTYSLDSITLSPPDITKDHITDIALVTPTPRELTSLRDDGRYNLTPHFSFMKSNLDSCMPNAFSLLLHFFKEQ